jgi:hypothetical protein
MPASTYYLDAVDLFSASVIYADNSMTALAAAGYYSDGVICRYWHYDAIIDYFVLDPPTYCEN